MQSSCTNSRLRTVAMSHIGPGEVQNPNSLLRECEDSQCCLLLHMSEGSTSITHRGDHPRVVMGINTRAIKHLFPGVPGSTQANEPRRAVHEEYPGRQKVLVTMAVSTTSALAGPGPGPGLVPGRSCESVARSSMPGSRTNHLVSVILIRVIALPISRPW